MIKQFTIIRKETLQFLNIAKGSLFELETQLFIAFDLKLIKESETDNLLLQLENLGKLINGYIRFLKTKLPTN
ncbi:hypothetical protein BCY91_02735 [Pelobium manganitolerans]|uniref:Four helix bundle protein n=1 Tax=Pelobium manganitolerans TaxID=1842495 RepID=A0A419S727_9SPHI|nr:four helix bundle protein [Pelobium manganitolerans]RKD17081.1 hypothetical protein BCY91_02735 [Pelobium manganitolerans]